MKKLKLYNGSDDGRAHLYVAAHSDKDAVELINQCPGRKGMTLYYLRMYFAKGAWGNTMNGIEPERGVWIQERDHEPVERLL